jgi:hypothetical protein
MLPCYSYPALIQVDSGRTTAVYMGCVFVGDSPVRASDVGVQRSV